MYSLASLSCIALFFGCIWASSIQDSTTVDDNDGIDFLNRPADDALKNATKRLPALPETIKSKSRSVNGSLNSSSECRKVCTPNACRNASCSKYTNATCISDICGCSARFVTLNLNRTGIVDVTEFCFENPSESVEDQIDYAAIPINPRIVDKDDTTSELPVLPVGSPANSTNSTTAPVALPTSTDVPPTSSQPPVTPPVQAVPQEIPQPSVTAPLQLYSVVHQPQQAYFYSSPRGQLTHRHGGGLGVFSALAFGQNGLFNIAPSILSQFPFSHLVAPGLGSRSLAIAGSQPDDETADDEDVNVLMDVLNDQVGDELVERKGGKKKNRGGGKKGANQAVGEDAGEGNSETAAQPDGNEEAAGVAGGTEATVQPAEKEEEETETSCRRVCRRRRRCFRSRRSRRSCRRRRVCRRVCN